jgi:flagellar protein FlaF
MSNSPFAAYEQQGKEFLSARELEASVLTRAGLKLKECQSKWDTPEKDRLLDEAVRFNQKVWSFFQSELSMPDNPLPKSLREDILNMSLFIDKRLFEVLAYPVDPAKLDIVININFNIAAGLRTNPTQTAP